MQAQNFFIESRELFFLSAQSQSILYESRDNFVDTALKHKVADTVQRKIVGDLAYLLLLSLYGHILVNYLAEIYLLEFFEMVELLPVLLKKFMDVFDIAGN